MMPRPTTPTVPFFRAAIARVLRPTPFFGRRRYHRKSWAAQGGFLSIPVFAYRWVRDRYEAERPICGETQMISTGLRSVTALLLGCLASAHAQGLVKTSRLSAALALEAVA